MNRPSSRFRACATGFTLTEVMIAVIVVMILASIAWPSYASYVIRSKRVEAIAVLHENMQQQERIYSLRNRYLAYSREENPDGLKWHSAASPQRSSHEISARPCEGHPLTACVELIAVPGTSGVDASFRDLMCGTLTLNSRGVRTPTAPACWQ